MFTAGSMQKRQTILVIENNPVIQELLTYCLTFSHYHYSMVNVMQLTSLTWIENSTSPFPDGIILDVDIYSTEFQRPFEFFYAFYTQWRNVATHMPPLLLLTTQPMLAMVLRRRGYTVLMKPFKLSDFRDGLEAAAKQEREGGTIPVKMVEFALV